MTDLTALQQSVSDLQGAVTDVVTKLEAAPASTTTSDVSQADVDALTRQVEQAVAQLKTAETPAAGSSTGSGDQVPASSSASETTGAAAGAGGTPPWQG